MLLGIPSNNLDPCLGLQLRELSLSAGHSREAEALEVMKVAGKTTDFLL